MGYSTLNFKKSKVRIKFYQNPRFRDKRLTISSLKFHVIHTKFILKVVSIPCWLDLGSSSSLLLLPLHLLFSFSPYGLFSSPQMRPTLVFKSSYALGLVWPSKLTHFWVKFVYFLFKPITHSYLQSNLCHIILWPLIL